MILHSFDIEHKVVILLDSASATLFLYHFIIGIFIQWKYQTVSVTEILIRYITACMDGAFLLNFIV